MPPFSFLRGTGSCTYFQTSLQSPGSFQMPCCFQHPQFFIAVHSFPPRDVTNLILMSCRSTSLLIYTCTNNQFLSCPFPSDNCYRNRTNSSIASICPTQLSYYGIKPITLLSSQESAYHPSFSSTDLPTPAQSYSPPVRLLPYHCLPSRLCGHRLSCPRL